MKKLAFVLCLCFSVSVMAAGNSSKDSFENTFSHTCASVQISNMKPSKSGEKIFSCTLPLQSGILQNELNISYLNDKSEGAKYPGIDPLKRDYAYTGQLMVNSINALAKDFYVEKAEATEVPYFDLGFACSGVKMFLVNKGNFQRKVLSVLTCKRPNQSKGIIVSYYFGVAGALHDLAESMYQKKVGDLNLMAAMTAKRLGLVK